MPDDDTPEGPEEPTTALGELFRIERLTGAREFSDRLTPMLVVAGTEAPGALRAGLLATAGREPPLLLIDRPKAAEPEAPIDVILPVAVARPVNRTNGHCPHARCCQCGAVRGTPEHAKACPDAAVTRALAKRSEGYVGRKLSTRRP